jgi:hypothetical protein
MVYHSPYYTNRKIYPDKWGTAINCTTDQAECMLWIENFSRSRKIKINGQWFVGKHNNAKIQECSMDWWHIFINNNGLWRQWNNNILFMLLVRNRGIWRYWHSSLGMLKWHYLFTIDSDVPVMNGQWMATYEAKNRNINLYFSLKVDVVSIHCMWQLSII